MKILVKSTDIKGIECEMGNLKGVLPSSNKQNYLAVNFRPMMATNNKKRKKILAGEADSLNK